MNTRNEIKNALQTLTNTLTKENEHFNFKQEEKITKTLWKAYIDIQKIKENK